MIVIDVHFVPVEFRLALHLCKCLFDGVAKMASFARIHYHRMHMEILDAEPGPIGRQIHINHSLARYLYQNRLFLEFEGAFVCNAFAFHLWRKAEICNVRVEDSTVGYLDAAANIGPAAIHGHRLDRTDADDQRGCVV